MPTQLFAKLERERNTGTLGTGSPLCGVKHWKEEPAPRAMNAENTAKLWKQNLETASSGPRFNKSHGDYHVGKADVEVRVRTRIDPRRAPAARNVVRSSHAKGLARGLAARRLLVAAVTARPRSCV